MEENNQYNNQETEIETKKPTNWWKVIVIILIIAAAIFGVVKLIEYKSTNNQNSDGSTQLTSRSARNSDITITTDMDWSTFGTKIIITPSVDIDNLKITVDIKDSNKTIIYTTQKFIGDVKKSVQSSCSISMSELGWANTLKAEYIYVTVSGGTVSYFA